MHQGFDIQPPFFELGPKAYLYGRGVVELAKAADRIGKRYDVRIIFTPQYVDIPLVVRETASLYIFAQHMDSIPVGRGIGAVLPEALKEAGAVGVLLNHAERRLTLSEINRTIKRADEVGLATLVCAEATGCTSAVIKAHDPAAMLESMIRAMREAWDTTHGRS
jgi:triosephosphate isomerase